MWMVLAARFSKRVRPKAAASIMLATVACHAGDARAVAHLWSEQSNRARQLATSDRPESELNGGR